MKIWIDAQLSPALAEWMKQQFQLSAIALRDLGLRDATDSNIFLAAKKEAAVVMTKDKDFIQLLDQWGTPPQILWITCGNTSNEQLKLILNQFFPQALKLLEAGEVLVEISDSW